MKKIMLALLVLVTGISSQAQYKPVEEGSSVKFRVKNFGFNTGGFFTGIKGSVRFDPANPNNASFDVTVDASTVNTDNESRDEHLRKEDYFDVKNHPLIHFVSTKVAASNKEGNFMVYGKLIIKSTTKEISFPFTASAAQDGYLFKGEFKINRRDFGVGGASTISDNVDISLVISSKKNQ